MLIIIKVKVDQVDVCGMCQCVASRVEYVCTCVCVYQVRKPTLPIIDVFQLYVRKSDILYKANGYVYVYVDTLSTISTYPSS